MNIIHLCLSLCFYKKILNDVGGANGPALRALKSFDRNTRKEQIMPKRLDLTTSYMSRVSNGESCGNLELWLLTWLVQVWMKAAQSAACRNRQSFPLPSDDVVHAPRLLADRGSKFSPI